MRNRILHLADLHLGDPHAYLGDLAPARRREADGVFHRITDFVLTSDRIGGVIIAGDLFDHHEPAAALVESVLADLERLRAAGIRTLTVPGNHDEYSYARSVYRIHGARWPDTVVTRATPGLVARWEIAKLEVDLYSMAFQAGRSQGPYDGFTIESGPAVKMAVLHGTLDAPAPDRSLPLSKRALERLGLDYVALGHLHAAEEWRLGSGWIAYPGRVEGGGFHDPGGHRLLEVELSPGVIGLHRTPFPSRRITTQRWDLSAVKSNDELDARFQRECGRPGGDRETRPILRLILEGTPACELELARLAERWRAWVHHLEIVGPEHSTGGIDVALLAEEPTMRGEFVRLARARIAATQTQRERESAEAALRAGLSAFAQTQSS